MATMDFFDCDCSFGRRGVVNPGSFYKLDDLISKMNRYGIKKALVYHSVAREYNPYTGNEMLLNEISGYGFLYPVWVALPHFNREFPRPDVLMQQMKINNVRAIRMFPSALEQNYSIAEWNCSELFSMLEKCGAPLIIGLDQLTWNDLFELCNNRPKIKIILAGADNRIDRNIYPMLKRFPNIYIETSSYRAHNGIEEICEQFGAQRLIFGSGMPVASGAAAVSMITYARISEREKFMIACENLEALMGGVIL